MEQEATAQQLEMPPQALIMQIASGAMLTQALGVAAELKIADLIGDGEKDADALAAATDTHSRSLYRVLRSLASIGVFRETSPWTFVNTPPSQTLRTDLPGSMYNSVLFMAAPWHHNVFANMLHSVKTGASAWGETHGVEVFEWFGQHSEESELFNQCMTELSTGAAPSIVEAYDFSGIQTLADIAGGHGYLLSQILEANPALRGILFDQEHVIRGAGPLLEREGVVDRVQTTSGDFFSEVPAADAYIMKHIIHDWDDERSIQILKTIHRAMIGDGKLLLAEMVVPEGNEPHYSKILDLEMLTSPGGIERTEAEFAELFEAAGFKLNRIVPTKSPFSVIEGVKAKSRF
jgi:hypothetical protein